MYLLTPDFMVKDTSKLPRYKGDPMIIEDIIIKKMEEEKPKFIINSYNYPPTPAGLPGEPSVSYIGPKTERYIFDNYSLVNIFADTRRGPRIGVYKRKESYSLLSK